MDVNILFSILVEAHNRYSVGLSELRYNIYIYIYAKITFFDACIVTIYRLTESIVIFNISNKTSLSLSAKTRKHSLECNQN